MGERAEKRRRQILKAAFRAVAEKGFDAVTLQDFADYAGVSKGVTSYYFKNKEDVLSQLLIWVTGRINEKECQAIQMGKTALAKLEAYVDAAFVSPEENSTFYSVYLDFLARASRNDAFQEINRAFYENCWSIGREIVELGKQEGVFNSETDPEQAAVAIRATIDGILIQWLMRGEEDMHGFYKKACLETIIGYLHK
ncbi:TetR/AcrR family transcriptional regulator [Bacillus marinisedimentorum]|uniref:TetR/AcrR family transcriptional regulator n=1 Tax=Bacillus marinisedimentorum TaxID=1821260 RepID=UPI000871CBA0|nr:TetR/AcrR family transcriptional regulator [Bacillus marinisedimentorum]